MSEKELLKQLNKLGLPLMEVEEEFSANVTLSEVVKSNRMRFLEGFPVLLANAAKEYSFEYEEVDKMLHSQNHKRRFRVLFLLSLALYEYYHLKFWWTNQYDQKLTQKERSQFLDLHSKLSDDNDFMVGDLKFNSTRLKNMFESYFTEQALEKEKERVKFEEFSLEYALSQVFSPKQKELFLKKQRGEKLTKTEREYFSRTVKRKLFALANENLTSFSKHLLGLQ